MIELAYTKRQSKVELDGYMIDFQDMIQYNTSDPNKQRRVRRDKSNDSAETVCHSKGAGSSIPRYSDRISMGASRFIAPPDLHVKSFGEWSISQFPMVEEWIKQNPYYKSKSKDTVEQIASGIEKEGSQMSLPKTLAAQYIANKLREFKDKPLHEIMYYCAAVYTYESFLYKLVNRVLREEDMTKYMTKVTTLGPYCCMLRNFLHEDKKTIYETVYRATNLEPKQFEEYKKSVGQIKTWLGFSSTSIFPEVAEQFGNTLFIIEFKNDAAQCYPGRAISSFSIYEHEKEILLYPGVDFRIDSVEETHKERPKYIIHLSLM
jgi:hypothetical protein